MKLITFSNLITLSNLFFGCLGIMYVVGENDLQKGAVCIVVALLLDFCDGFVARILKETSELGKQLDSLADMVSFGVLPAFILFMIIDGSSFFPEYTKYFTFVLALASCLRLAKFNIDTRQSYGFIGVPTPANAVLIASFAFLPQDHAWIQDLFTNSWFLVAYVALFSYLLNAEFPLPALKFKDFSWANNKSTYIFILLSIALLAALKVLAVPVIIFTYILTAAVRHLTKR